VRVCMCVCLCVASNRETLKFDRNHHHALMGATGVHLIVQKKGLYRPYGERSQTLKGIELFRWAAKVSERQPHVMPPWFLPVHASHGTRVLVIWAG
jgi:hypothetical protein